MSAELKNSFVNNHRFFLSFLIALFFTTLLAGCGLFGFGKKEDRPPDVLAQEAYRELKSGKYGSAAEDFEKIRDRLPVASPEARPGRAEGG